MQPDLIITPFGESADPETIREIPQSNPSGEPRQNASWEQGFPIVTMTPITAGGIPPEGPDMNGVLRAISRHTSFVGGGGQYKWSAEYVAAKGGYPKGAVIQANNGESSYVSMEDGNSTNFNAYPDSIGKQWDFFGGPSSYFKLQFDKEQQQRNDVFNQFLAGTAFEMPPIPFTEGAPIEISRPTQLVSYDGNLYSVKLPSSFPAILPGVWSVAEASLNLQTDRALRQQLASPGGDAMIARGSTTLAKYLDNREAYRVLEEFGKTDTPANTKATMQLAINACAASGATLTCLKKSYTVDLSASEITIPSNFACDMRGAKILRATGNKTPHDMWVNADKVNGNTNILIENVTFDGQAQADGLSNTVVAERFCGLRLVKCTGFLRNVRADATVNGETQTEGTRGGVMLEECPWIECENIYGDNNLGTALFIMNGKGRLSGFYGKNNTGSGISGNHPDWEFENLRSEGSGYSGVSLNGPGWVARGIYASGAAAGFAGVNFGHATPTTSNGTNAMASDVVAEDNLGWGVNVTSCPGISGDGWISKRSGNNNFRILNSPGCDIGIKALDGSANGVLIDGAGTHFISAIATGNQASGIYVQGGATVVLSSDTYLSGNGAISPAGAAELTAVASSRVTMKGRAVNGKAYGIQSTDSSVVILSSSLVSGNVTGPVRTATSGTIQYENARFGNDPMQGFATILAGATNVTVANGNIIDPSRVVFTPSNEAARALGNLRILSYNPGANFVAASGTAPATDAIFRYVML